MILNPCQPPSEQAALSSANGSNESLEVLFDYTGATPLADLSLPWKAETADSCKVTNDKGGLILDHSPNDADQRSAVVYKLGPNVWKRRLVVEAGLRVDRCDQTGGVVLGFSNGRRQEHVTFFPESIELRHAGISVRADIRDRFIICRLEIDGDDLLVYVDGELLIDARGKSTYPGYRPPGIEFGTIMPKARARSIWKFVRAFLGKDAAIPMPRLHPARHVTVYQEKNAYPLFPHLIQSTDGTLQVDCVLRGTSSHMDVEGSTLSLTSTDEGETWSRTTESITNPARIGRGGVLSYANAIGWRYDTDKALAAELEKEGVELRWKGDRFAYARGCYSARSTDHGRSWTQTPVDFPQASILMHYHEAATLLRLDEDTQLRAVYTKTTIAPDCGYFEPYVLRTTDNGLTWEAIRIYSDPLKKISLGETALVQAPNGDILAMMRQEPVVPNASLWISRHLSFWTSRSSDGGKTWSVPERTPIVGHPASLLCRKNGSIVCTYGYRLHPIGIRAAVSHDNGATWQHVGELILRADGYGSPADNGYPITVEKKSGGLFTCYYLTDTEGVPYIAGTHWDI